MEDASLGYLGGPLPERANIVVTKLYFTLIDDSKDADTFFPPYEKEFTKKFPTSHVNWKESNTAGLIWNANAPNS